MNCSLFISQYCVTSKFSSTISIKQVGEQRRQRNRNVRRKKRRRRMVVDTSEPEMDIPLYIHVFYPENIPIATSGNPTVNIADEQIYSMELILFEDYSALNHWILSNTISERFQSGIGNPKLFPYVDTIKRISKPEGWTMDFGTSIEDNEKYLKDDTFGGSSSHQPVTFLDCVASSDEWREGIMIQPQYVGRVEDR